MTSSHPGIRRLHFALLTMAASSALMVKPAPVQAQALQPVVDVCTGVQVNDSLLRDILSRTVVPTATGVENLFDSLLNISIMGAPLLVLPDVDLGIAQTTADIAAGNVVSLEVLDTDGNIVSPGNCNITADGIALNTPAGIAIGGNQITGLGAGDPATAAELDAIAFGNGAEALAGATGSIALGTDASIAAANGVSLGAGSTNTRGPLAGYTAFGITGPVNSVGTVSIGAPGAERQLTNVAPGTAPTDAATVGQVQGAIAAITADSVQYDDPSHAVVTLTGATGTLLTNVAPGTIADGSTDAINGDQLFDTNQQVAANTAGIAANAADITAVEGQVATNTAAIATNTAAIATNTGDIAALDTQVTTNTGDIAALDAQVTTNTGDIAALDAQVTTNTADIAALEATAVQYDDPTQASITLGGANGTTISNLAAGELSATSTEAVNGAQLFATNQQVAANTADIATLQTGLGSVVGDISDLQADVAVNTADIDALDGRVTTNETNIAALDGRVTTVEGDVASLDGRVTNVEGDIASLDGRVTVNEGDIASLDGRVTVNEGDIASLDGRVTVNEGDIASLDGRVTVNEGDIANLETDVSAIDARVTTNATNVAVLQTQVANVPVQFVSNADGTTPSAVPTNTVAVRSADGGPATVTNVAAGTLSATSTDAVNGSQLFATNQAVAQNTADIAAINTNLAGSTVVAVQYSNPGTPTVSNGGTITNDVTLVGADASVPVRVHNVAAGTAPTDAANVGQLQAAMSELQGSIGQTLLDANGYTDLRIAEIGFDLRDLRKNAFSGTAAAMALASIPQTMTVGESMVGGAVGHYRGETAFGLGFSTTAGDRVVVKASGTFDTRGHGGVAAGAGFSF